MDRRDVIKLIGLGMAGLGVPLGTAKAGGVSGKGGYSEASSPLARLLMDDWLREKDLPLYELRENEDAKASPLLAVVAYQRPRGRGTFAVEVCEGDKLCLPRFGALGAREEEVLILEILQLMAGPLRTVTCVGGLTWTGLDHACSLLDHRLDDSGVLRYDPEDRYEVAHMVGHPELFRRAHLSLPTLFDKIPIGAGEDVDAEMRSVVYYDAKDQEHESPQREVTLIASGRMRKDRLYITAQPDQVGVYAHFPDGQVALAGLNPKGVATLVVEEG